MLCSGLLALWQHPQQKNVWLERAKKLGWGPGGYVAPQAACRPLTVLQFGQSVAKGVFCPFKAWKSMRGARAGQWLKYLVSS